MLFIYILGEEHSGGAQVRGKEVPFAREVPFIYARDEEPLGWGSSFMYLAEEPLGRCSSFMYLVEEPLGRCSLFMYLAEEPLVIYVFG